MKIRDEIDALARSYTSIAEGEKAPSMTIVTTQDIAHVVSAWTNIPLKKMTVNDTERLLQLEEILHSRLIGQDEAVVSIARSMRRARSGLKISGRPIAAFMLKVQPE